METAFEKILTGSHKAEMVSYMAANPESFREAMELAIADKQPYSWRAAWLIWSCMEKNDKRVRKYAKEIINILPNRKDNQKRELLKILENMEIEEVFEATLFDHCVNIWKRIDKQPSVRFCAFKILAKISKKHPELSDEVLLLTEDQYMESLSPGVNRSINRIMKDLK
jgi:hypothetical protein